MADNGTIVTQPPADLLTAKGRQASRNRHGLRGVALPRGCGHVRRSVDAYRRNVEAAVLDVYGEINLYRASLVSSAYRHERTAQLCERYLRVEQDSLDPSQRLAYLKQISDATDRRDKCLAQLGLDQSNNGDLWQTLQGHVVAQDRPEIVQTPDTVQQATNGQTQPTGRTGDESEPT